MGLRSEDASPSLAIARPLCFSGILVTLAFLFLLQRYTIRRTSIPTQWPVIGMLPALLSNLHRIHDFATDLLAESGCTFHIQSPGMDLLVTADPANFNHIYNTKFSNYPKGVEFLEIFEILGQGIFNADSDSWRAQRSLMHSLMAEERFRRYAARTTQRKIQEGLIPLLDDAGTSVTDKDHDYAVVDLQDLFLRFTFDTSCMQVLGIDTGCLSKGLPTVEFADAVDIAEEVLIVRHIVPRPIWRLMRMLRVGVEAKMARASVTIDEFMYRHIRERRKEVSKTASEGMRSCDRDLDEEDAASSDLLTSFLEGKGSLDAMVSAGLDFRSDTFLRDMILNLLVAGRDTTATALSWFFHLVSTHPKAKEGILRELRTLQPDHSQPGPVLFDLDKLGQLVYLHAALLETLRLYPSVPINHKANLSPEILPSGHAVQPGAKLILYVYAMGRMQRVWGADAAEFRPERWLNERGRLRHEPSYKFAAFSSGPRTCLGKDLALNSMKAVSAALLYNYEFKPVQGHVVEPKPSVVLQMKYGLKVAVRRRKFSTELDDYPEVALELNKNQEP